MYSRNPRVLIIEDDPDTRSNLCDILEIDGYDIDVAATIAETMQPRDWESLFAIILDRRLPDGSADLLLPMIRDLAPKAAVIVVTGNADLEGAIGVIRHGIADFIPKPIDPDMLRASLARTVRLREMEERARQDERLATIGRMMASVAHESRNALQRIAASTDLLELSVAGDQEALRDVHNVRSAAGDLQAMLEEIRSFASSIHLHRQEVHLDQIWVKAWGHLSPELKIESTLTVAPNDFPLRCYVDPMRMVQVFRNLFENSIAACSGKSNITIRLEKASRGPVKCVRIFVTDDGPGLTECQLAQLFEPFFTTKPEGTGLGLAIVRRIIDAHGGRVYAGDNSEGATFVIELPCHQDASNSAADSSDRTEVAT
ncbi:Sensor protein ZraS [Rubripirellula amarantea]|uniref:histidine kinase n=1 Tax=Rubripirellula amarantea TaxID=2527999 RepID=A0A5C5WK93_9BACT|nr:ATP-binding protein [Rubripirellula amarantea]TWT51234.1 Sensor protein ZraS [Rubripirellula amarantea]